MGKKRRIEFTLETEEVMVIRKRGKPLVAWCGECNRQARMVTVDEAAAVAGASWREIFRRVEAGRLHFTETPERGLRICLNSLLN